MDKRECIDCGRALVDYVRGRPALRCGECKRGRRRIKARPMQRCMDCGVEFDPPGHTGRPPERCQPCRAKRKKITDAAKARRWRDADPERQRMYSRLSNRKRLADPEYLQWKRDDALRRAYGITRADLDALIQQQDGKCAICGGGPNGPGSRLHVDHCHNSKKVRGLLCGKCNTAIGLLGDDPDRAEAAAAYLRR